MYDKAIHKNIFNVGSEFSGLADEVAKAIGIPTGIANTKFFGWADDAATWAGEAVPFLGKAAPFLGKALPVADVFFGGAQMIEGIQSGDTFSAITGGAGALGGGLMIAGGALSATGIGAVVGGPIAAAGAIISGGAALADVGDRKSTRLNSSHVSISYAVFCLKKKNIRDVDIGIVVDHNSTRAD